MKKIEELPPLPLVLQKLLSAVADPNSNAQELASVISKDQALTARILKVVNSSYYGFDKGIPNISRAVVVLGFHTVRKMALSLGMIKLFQQKDDAPHFNRKHFWEHSLETAICANWIARRCGVLNTENVYIAALLHDVGRLVLNTYFQKEFIDAIQLAKSAGLSLRFAEDKMIGTNHSKIGHRMAEQWKLPTLAALCIRFHHNPLAAQKQTDANGLASIAIVHVADLYSKSLTNRYPSIATLEHIEPEIWQLLSFSKDQLVELQSDIEDEIEQSKLYLR